MSAPGAERPPRTRPVWRSFAVTDLILVPAGQPPAARSRWRAPRPAGVAAKSERVQLRFLETAATMANHTSTRTTQLYDRRHDQVTLAEVERVRI